MNGDERSVLVLFAHPNPASSKVNSRLRSAIDGMPGIMVNDLYERYPDFHIDVKREQDLLRKARLVVFLHPIYWYSAPAILKEWQDLVLEYGFAYGEGGTSLAGKDFVMAISTGGDAHSYRAEGRNRFPILDLLRPFEQTAGLCGMRYLPPYVFHGAGSRNESDVERHVSEFQRRLTHYQVTGLWTDDGGTPP